MARTPDGESADGGRSLPCYLVLVSSLASGRAQRSERLSVDDLEILKEVQVGSLQRPLVVAGFPDVPEVLLVGHRLHDGEGEHERLLGVLAIARLAGVHPLVVDGELMA